MTTFIIGITIILILFFGVLCYLIYKINTPVTSSEVATNNLNKITHLDWKVKTLLLLVLILVIISFFIPFILTRPAINNDFNFSETGQIGDTIGGLMNPFVALAGVIVTGLAFYIQFKANLQQRELFIQEQFENKKQLQEQIDIQNKQIKRQQFESQFYEMLKLHRDNVTEMIITGYDFEEEEKMKKFKKTTDGRKVFVTMKTELECIISVFSKNHKLDKQVLEKCYQLFFSGLDEFKKFNPQEKKVIETLKKASKQHENPSSLKIISNKIRKEYSNETKLYFNYKPFSGHASKLGHYFRHLFLIVKSIVNSEIITDYNEKMKYLRILRAQLSNHEQILMFYNWLGGHGNPWENDKNSFFTEYCMIHNLWYHQLYEDSYISEKVNELRVKNVQLRKSEMYEID